METNKKQLINALQKLVKVCYPGRTALSILKCVRIMADKNAIYLTTTNLKQILTITLVGEGNMCACVNAKDLLACLKNETSSNVDISLSGNYLLVKGNSTVSIYNQTCDDFPADPGYFEDVEVLETRPFRYAFERVCGAVSKDTSRPALTGIHIANGIMEATDGFKLARYHIDSKVDMIIPSVFLENSMAWCRGDTITVRKNKDGVISFEFDNIIYYTTLIDLVYPDTSFLKRYEDGDIVEYDKKQLLSLLKAFNKCNWIFLGFQNGEMRITSDDDIFGSMPVNGKASTFVINPVFLAGCVEMYDGNTMLIRRSDYPIWFGDSICLMPMNKN